MRFGLGQFTLQIPPWDPRTHAELYADTLELAARADAAGFDSFWLAEHHAAADGYNPALLPFLAAVGARTTTIRLGTAVMLAPLHHPLRVAEDAAVVANLSGGRLQVGLGLGWAPEEYRMFSVEAKGRGKRLAEFAQVVRAAWTQERFSFDGDFFDYDDIAVTPKPPGPIPLWLGGSADAAVERAARVGDGYFPPSTHGLHGLVERAQTVMAARESSGLSAPFGFGTFVPVGLGATENEAWDSIRDGVLHVRGSYLLWAQSERDVSRAREAAAAWEADVRAACVLGTPEQVAEQIGSVMRRIESMGFGEVFFSAILAPPGTDPSRARETVDRYASEVIPLLR